MVDLDGTIYPFVQVFRSYLVTVELYAPGPLTPPKNWRIHEDWGIPVKELWQAHDRGVDAGFIYRRGDPMPGTLDGLRLLASAGVSIHIVTARFGGSPGVMRKSTADWLCRHKIPHDTLHFIRDSKRIVRADWAVDDWAKHLEHFPKYMGFLMDQPWNQDSDRPRVTNMVQFAKYVLGMEQIP
jgi:hypothetical protein